MKKKIFIMGFAALMLGMASCSEDRGPKYQNPTEFVLNVPAMENQYIALSEAGTLELTCSQPDYGYSAVANYSAEISLTSDFSTYEAISPINAHLANMTFNQENIAIALCTLLGLESEDDFTEAYPDKMMPYMPVYFRAVCQLSGVEGSLIKSNVVQYQHLQPYFAVATPGYIYFIGKASGWNEPSEGNSETLKNWRLFEPETAIGSKVYSGTFEINAGEAQFRFYSALTGWGSTNCYGADIPDQNDVPTYLVDGSYTGAIVVGGQSNWDIQGWSGGKMTIVVNLSDEKNPTIEIYEGDVEVTVTLYAYMVGNQASWAEPSESNQEIYDNWRLIDEGGTGVYSGTFEMEDVENNTLYCRFYKALTGWGNAPWSADSNNSNIDVALGTAYPTEEGEGNFVISGVNGHKLNVVLDTNVPNVTFTFAD